MLKNKMIVLIVISIVFTATVAGAVYLIYGGKEETEPVNLNQVGSDTMFELGTTWAQEYHKMNSKVTIKVVGGGSTKGIQALLNGSADIAQASREMKSEEMDTAKAQNIDPLDLKVAIDGVAVVVNDDNPIKELTMDQLKRLYNGSIGDWEMLGWSGSGPVNLIGRNNLSGTFAYFQESVLKGAPYSENMTELAGNPAILNSVSSDPYAIGYVGIGYAKSATGIKILALRGSDSASSHSPLEADAVVSGEYVLSRYLHLYTNGTPTGPMLDYLAWVIDPEGGQKVASEIGFYPLTEDIIQDQRQRLGI
jgi:phosphate transport system substrate-binding protein